MMHHYDFPHKFEPAYFADGDHCIVCGSFERDPIHHKFFVRNTARQLEIDFTKAKLDAQALARRTQPHGELSYRSAFEVGFDEGFNECYADEH
jgi:hypothetical protein